MKRSPGSYDNVLYALNFLLDKYNSKVYKWLLLEIYNMTSKDRHLGLLKEFERGARRHFEEGEFISSAVDAFDAAIQAIEALLATVNLHPRVHAQREAFMGSSGLFPQAIIELHDKIYRLADRQLRYGEVRDGERAREALKWMEQIIAYCVGRLSE